MYQSLYGITDTVINRLMGSNKAILMSTKCAFPYHFISQYEIGTQDANFQKIQ